MSERPINDPQSTPQAPTSVDASARQLASARRRRFLKIGGAAVPTALTLSSRPVMAWSCNTASMWGSVQGMANSAYTRSRVSNQTLWADDTYTKANWVSNNSWTGGLPASPWTAIGCNASASGRWKNFKTLLISDVIGASIAGVDSTQLLWNFLNTTGDEYKSLMVVAWLNYKTLVVKNNTSPGLGKCLVPQSTNTLVWMGQVGSGTVTGPDGRSWNKDRVVTYLKGNYVARPS